MSDYQAIILKAGSCQLELVPEFGGLTNKLVLAAPGKPGIDLIAGLSNREAMMEDKGYHNIPLFPLVNRLDAGRYELNGKQYQLEANEASLNNALHGFLQYIEPNVSLEENSADSAKATLHYAYSGHLPGYPFTAEVTIEYVLESSGNLTISYSAHNTHNEAIPVGLGWHPYFQLGSKMDQLSLKLPKVKHTLIDDRMLPTGEKKDFTEFEKLTVIGARTFDDCFEVIDQTSTAETILWSNAKNHGMKLWQHTGENNFNFIQVCIAPDRQSIAIEPVSCGINAFNTKDGLIMLEPGASTSLKCGVQCVYA